MKIQIKTTFGDVRFEGDFESLAAAVVTAVESGAKLSRANLSRANLYGADLSGANLSRANLSRANLSRADLSGANLSRADLYGAKLSGANLSGADLYGADLYGADLSRAKLYGAKLSGADLYGADLYGANLSRANLSRANLYGADLYGADLSRANLYGANDAALAVAQTRILPAGDLIGWKKCVGGHIVKLSIPADAKRSHAFGRKCRAEWANVLEIVDAKGEALKETKSGRGGIYKTGKRVAPDSWDDNWQNECAGGIHFFITREEAEAYTP